MPRPKAKWSRPRLAVDRRCAAELGERDHQGLFEQPALIEITEQGGHDMVELGDEFLVRSRSSGHGCPTSARPTRTKGTPASIKRRATNRLLAELGSARRGRGSAGALRDIEESLAGHQAPDSLIGLVVLLLGHCSRRDRLARTACCRQFAELATLPVVEVRDRDGAADVLGDQARGQLHRCVPPSRGTRSNPAQVTPFGRGIERDESGTWLSPAELAGEHGASRSG